MFHVLPAVSQIHNNNSVIILCRLVCSVYLYMVPVQWTGEYLMKLPTVNSDTCGWRFAYKAHTEYLFLYFNPCSFFFFFKASIFL